jgi:hypothetical protein
MSNVEEIVKGLNSLKQIVCNSNGIIPDKISPEQLQYLLNAIDLYRNLVLQYLERYSTKTQFKEDVDENRTQNDC